MLGTRANRDGKPDDDEQPARAASAIIAPARHDRYQRHSRSSIGWRRSPGRGTFCEVAPLLGPLPAPASRGGEENARTKKFAEKINIFMDANTTRFQPFNTRLIVRKGCVDSSKIPSREPKFRRRTAGWANRACPESSTSP